MMIVSCDRVSEEILAPVTGEIDSTGYVAVQINNFNLKYKIIGSDLYCILSAETNGWLAVGFNPESMMRGANFIIGWVNGSTAQIRDDYGVSLTTHDADINLGGSSDITLLNYSETGQTTTLHFKLPLNSGDAKDTVLLDNGVYPVIFASGAADDFSSMHVNTGMINIDLSLGK